MLPYSESYTYKMKSISLKFYMYINYKKILHTNIATLQYYYTYQYRISERISNRMTGADL